MVDGGETSARKGVCVLLIKCVHVVKQCKADGLRSMFILFASDSVDLPAVSNTTTTYFTDSISSYLPPKRLTDVLGADPHSDACLAIEHSPMCHNRR